jgi:hypothetical protein
VQVVALLDDQPIGRLQRQVVAMGTQDRLDGRGVDAIGELVRDPGCLGALLELADVLLAAPAVHRHDRNETAAGNEPDEQQPPLEFGHVAGRIGPVAERTLPR